MERRLNSILGLVVAAAVGLIAWRMAVTHLRADRAENRITEVADEGRLHAAAEGRALIEAARFAVEVDPAEALAILSNVVDAGNNADDTDEIRMIAADAAGRGYAHRLAGKTRAHGISVSSDGFLLAVAGDDRKIHIWTLSGERTEQQALTGHERRVLDVVWSGERELVSIDSGGEARRWNLNESSSGFVIRASTGNYRAGMLSAAGDRAVMFVGGDADLLTFGAADRSLRDCAHAAWSPDGSLAYADKTTVHVLTATGTETKLPAPPGLTALAVHHDVYAGFADGSVRTLGTDRVDHRHAGPVTQLALAGDVVISASSDLDDGTEGDHLVMAIRDHQTFRLRGHPGPIDALTTRNGAIVSAGRNGELRAWVLPPMATRLQWRGDGKLAYAAIAGDGNSVAVARSGPAIDIVALHDGKQTALALDPGTDVDPTRTEIGPNGEKVQRRLTVPKAAIRRFVASADGRRIATLDDSYSVIAWDTAARGRAIGTGYLELAQSSDGNQLAAISRDNMIRVWKRGGTGVDVINTEPVDAIAIDPLGMLALAYKRGGFGLISPNGVLAFGVSGNPKAPGRALAFAGRYALAGADDGSVSAIDSMNGTLMPLFTAGAPIREIAVSRSVAAAIDATGTFSTFDAGHLVDPMTNQPHRGHAGPINSLALDQMVSAGDDHTVRVWSTTGSRIVARHAARVIAAAATPKSVISVDELGVILETPDPLPRDADGLRVWLGNR